MHPPALLLIMVVTAGAAAMVHGHRTAAHTPAALFWEKAMPGTRMPDTIAHLVQRGIDDHSPLVEHYTASPSANNVCIIYDVVCNLRSRPPLLPRGAAASRQHHDRLLPGRAGVRHPPARRRQQGPLHKPPRRPRRLQHPGGLRRGGGGERHPAQVPGAVAPHRRRAQGVRHVAGGHRAERHGGMDMLGATNGGGAWAAASALPRSGLPPQQYEVEEVTPLAATGDQYVACHKMPFPYAVYHCHMTGVSTKAYKVSLRSRAAAAMVVVAVCHHDTSRWNPAHPAFEVLHTRPGGAPVCHLMPYANLVFGKKAEGTAIF
ncbi:unnamed protein product [Urochloa decumbens]|uniref:BURP domain-containing protein n=1 Tax=Urochloa decumbens TaxID=240449 RepID=A0ABC8WAW8_9POAL